MDMLRRDHIPDHRSAASTPEWTGNGHGPRQKPAAATVDSRIGEKVVMSAQLLCRRAGMTPVVPAAIYPPLHKTQGRRTHIFRSGERKRKTGSRATPCELLPEGQGRTRNFLLLVSVPLGVVTLTNPVVAPLGTIAVRYVLAFTVKAALIP